MSIEFPTFVLNLYIMLGIIINPKSGKKAFRLQRLYLWRLLKERHQPFVYRLTKYESHAIELARELVERGCDEILILGGDGTLSEAVNGIMRANIPAEQRRKISIGLMPRGTGNDWGRYWNIDRRDFRGALDKFFNGDVHPLDIGCITYWRNGVEHHRYFINSVGFGVDSMCCYCAEKLKNYIGSHALNYFFALFVALAKYKPRHTKITCDGQVIAEEKLFTMNIGNGPFSGGGIRQNPDANPTDGVFDSMFVTPPTFSQIIKAVPHVFDGRLTELPFIHTFRGKEVVVQSRAHFMVEADGILQHFMGPCRVTCEHHALNFKV